MTRHPIYAGGGPLVRSRHKPYLRPSSAPPKTKMHERSHLILSLWMCPTKNQLVCLPKNTKQRQLRSHFSPLQNSVGKGKNHWLRTSAAPRPSRMRRTTNNQPCAETRNLCVDCRITVDVYHTSFPVLLRRDKCRYSNGLIHTKGDNLRGFTLQLGYLTQPNLARRPRSECKPLIYKHKLPARKTDLQLPSCRLSKGPRGEAEVRDVPPSPCSLVMTESVKMKVGLHTIEVCR